MLSRKLKPLAILIGLSGIAFGLALRTPQGTIIGAVILVIVWAMRIKDKTNRWGIIGSVLALAGLIIAIETIVDPNLTIKPYTLSYEGPKEGYYKAKLFFRVDKRGLDVVKDIDYDIWIKYGDAEKEFKESWYRNDRSSYLPPEMGLFHKKYELWVSFPVRENQKKEFHDNKKDLDITVELYYKTGLKIKPIEHLKKYKYIHLAPEDKDQFVRIE